MNNRASMDIVDFNLNPEQQEKFNAIYLETSKLYPHLCADEFQRHRTKVLIAHSVITDDKKLSKEENEEIDVIEETEE